MKDFWPIIGAGLVLAIASSIIFVAKKNGGQLPKPSPSPTPQVVEQLKDEDQPKVSMQFSGDGHYVTVSVSNLHGEQLEYNLIYDVTVKNNKIQTGVNATASIKGKTTYTQKQLLGSESSGKFTYHSDIKNAVMELTLRDANNSSIFSATYPFIILLGKSSELKVNL